LRLRISFAFPLACAVAVAGCRGAETATTMEKSALSFEQITPQDWQRLANERIFFGHQSVGQNLLDGVRDVVASNPNIRLNIVEVKNGAPVDGPGFYHMFIGENGKPASKLAAFRDAVANVGESGTALMKYCYVDVNFASNPKSMFEEYRRTVDEVRAKQPAIRIVHVTLPLTTDAGTIRYVAAVVRRLPTSRTLNLIRHEYNEMLRAEYGGKEPIFDLALLESTEPDGTQKLVRYKGERVPVLSNAWTYDGGHLNEAGRRRIAEAFLTTLVSLQQPVLSTR
jgi:lysophospholipase L1-like esterase